MSRDSLQSAQKNQVLKLKIDKVTVIRVHSNAPYWRTPPYNLDTSRAVPCAVECSSNRVGLNLVLIYGRPTTVPVYTAVPWTIDSKHPLFQIDIQKTNEID